MFVFCSFVVCFPSRKDSKSLIGGSIVIEVYCYDETLTGLDEISIIIDGCSLKLGGVADEAQYVQYSRWRWVFSVVGVDILVVSCGKMLCLVW